MNALHQEALKDLVELQSGICQSYPNYYPIIRIGYPLRVNPP